MFLALKSLAPLELFRVPLHVRKILGNLCTFLRSKNDNNEMDDDDNLCSK